MYKFSKLSNQVKESGLQKLLNIPNISDYVSLGLGLPSPDTFPSISLDGVEMQYIPPQEKLKSQIKDILTSRGINCSQEEIFLTSGAQQAISLLIRLFCDPGDIVLCEELTYYGFVQAAQSSGAKIETIHQDSFDGICAREIEKKIKSLNKLPKLIYLIPTGHNPTGVSLSKEKRAEIIKIAAKYGIPIIEDDAYGLLNYYPSEEKQAMQSMTKENNIFYVSSFSKILAPSLRVGYILVPKEYNEKLAILKEASDLNVSSFGMGLASKFLEENSFEDHIQFVIDNYRKKRDIMADSIEKHLSDFVSYKIPDAGMYFWLETVDDIDSMELYKKALEKKLIIMPGSAFEVTDSEMGRNGIRLNFTHPSKEDIEIGISRLGKLF